MQYVLCIYIYTEDIFHFANVTVPMCVFDRVRYIHIKEMYTLFLFVFHSFTTCAYYYQRLLVKLLLSLSYRSHSKFIGSVFLHFQLLRGLLLLCANL